MHKILLLVFSMIFFLSVPKAQKLTSFSVKDSSGSVRFGYLNEKGDEVIRPVYSYAGAFNNSLAPVNIGGRYYFMQVGTNKPCLEGGKWGYIDPSGKLMVPATFGFADEFSEGLAAVNIGGESHPEFIVSGGYWTYIDVKGNIVFQDTFTSAEPFQNGLAIVNKAFNYSIIDKSGKALLPFHYSYIGRPTKNIFIVGARIDSTGKFYNNSHEQDYTFWDENSNEEVIIKAKYGLINEKAELITALKYDWIYPFREGRAQIVQNKKYGFIDETGREIVPCIYDWVNAFEGGKAKVISGEKELYLALDGTVIR